MTTQLGRGHLCFVQECCEYALIMKIKPKASQAVQPNWAAHVWIKLEPTLENIDNCASACSHSSRWSKKNLSDFKEGNVMSLLPTKMCDDRIHLKCNSIFHFYGAVFNEFDCLKQCYKRRIKSHFENYYIYGRANTFPLQFWRICLCYIIYNVFQIFAECKKKEYLY